ncbi:MAG: response regulator transcription factor [Burkholderiaceae bacterium]
MSELTLIIADDHPLFREALKEAVGRQVPGARIVEASSLDTLRRAVADNPDADLILLDLRMPGAQGLSSLLYLRAEHPAVPAVVVSAWEDATIVQRAFDFGASGFIPKSASIETILESLRTVLAGGVYAPTLTETGVVEERQDREHARHLASLTHQQLRVLTMLADGQSNKHIAAQLSITEATVKAHITAILRKLGIERRTQAAILAQRLLHINQHADLNCLEEDEI